eukprot:TCONS_00003589-protein
MNRIFASVKQVTRIISSSVGQQSGGILNNLFNNGSAVGRRQGILGGFEILQIRGAKFGREYQPNNYQRKKKHGYLKRKKTAAGREVLARRAAKGRKWLSH